MLFISYQYPVSLFRSREFTPKHKVNGKVDNHLNFDESSAENTHTNMNQISSFIPRFNDCRSINISDTMIDATGTNGKCRALPPFQGEFTRHGKIN